MVVKSSYRLNVHKGWVNGPWIEEGARTGPVQTPPLRRDVLCHDTASIVHETYRGVAIMKLNPRLLLRGGTQRTAWVVLVVDAGY